jgi:[ribosomal protein S5]-alanine N-acetyltransferase
MKGPRTLETARLVLRKPTLHDGQAIFERYAGDPIVTRYMSWPTHRTLADTHAFLAWSEGDWELWPAGSYLIYSRSTNGLLLGGTGLTFRTPLLAVTGYVLAQDAWGQGFATESLGAMVELARQTGVKRLEAECHAEHRASAHVLEKCGFHCEGVSPAHTEFPNLALGCRCDVLGYSMRFNA